MYVSEGEDGCPRLLPVPVAREHGLCSTYGTCLNYGLQPCFVSIRVALFRKWPMEVQNYDDHQVHVLLEKTKASPRVCTQHNIHRHTSHFKKKS